MFFNCKTTWLYCATCSSPRLGQSPTRMLPLKTLLLVLYLILPLTLTLMLTLTLTLTLALTLLLLLFRFPVLEPPHFVVLPRWALWGQPKHKQNNTANADSQPIPNTQETTIQNLTSRICKLEKLFANEVSTCTSITAGVHSHYFLLCDKVRQLELGNSDVIIWKIPSVKFVFDSAKVARPSSDPLIEPATSFSSPNFRTHPHGYNFFIKLYPYGIGPATGKCASVLFALFPGDYDNLLQWPFTKTIHIGIRDQLDPMNTWTKTILPDQDPAYKKPTMSTKTGVATILINKFIPHSNLFSETEGFLIDGSSFVEIKFSDPPVLKPHTQTSLLFPFP